MPSWTLPAARSTNMARVWLSHGMVRRRLHLPMVSRLVQCSTVMDYVLRAIRLRPMALSFSQVKRVSSSLTPTASKSVAACSPAKSSLLTRSSAVSEVMRKSRPRFVPCIHMAHGLMSIVLSLALSQHRKWVLRSRMSLCVRISVRLVTQAKTSACF